MNKLFFLLIPFLSFSQQIDKVDFTKCNATILPQFDSRLVQGNVTYQFKVKSNIDSIRIDALNMDFSEVKINGIAVKYKNNKKELILFEGFKKGKNTLKFIYQAIPKQTMYFTGIEKGQQIWTQGQGKYTSHWLPSFDNVNEKVIFAISVDFNNEFEVISNGKLIGKESINSGKSKWNFEMKKPMSSYLVMLAVGDFLHKTEMSKSRIPLENYYKPIDEAKYEATYKDSKRIFDYLEKEIGVKYPWEIYRQIPVEDFLYAGMENTSSTLFAQDFVVDEIGFNDRNYINVNAHELAHQWFGDMVTAKSGKHHWLQEGFATYYALLAERDVFGEDYFYYALYKNAMILRKEAKTDTIPVLNEKASSYSFYQKGAWALHVIRESIGEKKFQKAVKSYLKKYKFKNVETSDFLNEIAKVSDFDIVKFQKEWLEEYHFQTEQANELLKKNEFIRSLFEIQSQKNKTFSEKEVFFTEIMKSTSFQALKTEILYQITAIPFEKKETLIRLAMLSSDVEVRQAVAQILKSIPISFKSEYETLLNDNSYDTKEIAFINLYQTFPDEQANYLNLAKDWVGKNDKGLRILYCATFMSYASQHEDNQSLADLYLKYFNELMEYTSPKYESSIRQNALERFLSIDSKNKMVLKNLVNATTHHKWQFVKYARETIRSLLKKEGFQELFTSILPELSDKEKFQLQRLLDEK
jgi:aminopeptidase N